MPYADIDLVIHDAVSGHNAPVIWIIIRRVVHIRGSSVCVPRMVIKYHPRVHTRRPIRFNQVSISEPFKNFERDPPINWYTFRIGIYILTMDKQEFLFWSFRLSRNSAKLSLECILLSATICSHWTAEKDSCIRMRSWSLVARITILIQLLRSSSVNSSGWW